MESNSIINHQNCQGERHDSQNEGTQGEEQRPSNQTARRKRIISYKRPSRDYSKTKIKWSYELNKDLYNCYLESDHKTHGYMKRLKSLWDEKRPEHNQLSEKYLHEQASRIIKKNLVVTNRQQSDTCSRRTNNQSTEYNEGWILNQNEPNTNGTRDAQDNREEINTSRTRDTQENTEKINTSTQDNANNLNIDEEFYKVLKEKWDGYYEKYKDMNVQNRDYSTHISGQIADGQWRVIDLIVDRDLKSINETREITLNMLGETAVL